MRVQLAERTDQRGRPRADLRDFVMQGMLPAGTAQPRAAASGSGRLILASAATTAKIKPNFSRKIVAYRGKSVVACAAPRTPAPSSEAALPRLLHVLVALATISFTPGPAHAIPPFEKERTVVTTAPGGERVTLTLQWTSHSVGPGGGVPFAEWVCDSWFEGPATSVALISAVACYFPESGDVTNGIPTQAPGPRSVAGGAGRRGSYSAQICVQGITQYLGSPLIENIITPLRCFDP